MKWFKLGAIYLLSVAMLAALRMTQQSPLEWLNWGLIALAAIPFTILGKFAKSPLWSRLLSPSSPLTPDGFVNFLWTNPLAKKIEHTSSAKSFSLLRLAYAFFVLLTCFLFMGILHYFLQ